MKIEACLYSDFNISGAINIDIGQNSIDVLDSAFIRCKSNMSGGAVRVVAQGNCRFERNCGTECSTTQYNGILDFGQFLFVNCSGKNVVYEMLTANMCPYINVAEKHNGPLSFCGSAKLACSHSNASNNYCRMGPGFASFDSIDVELSYMNFANDTVYATGTSNYWIAAFFYRSQGGEVAQSNFISCDSMVQTPTKPPGVYNNCAFVLCNGYGVELLDGVGNTDNILNIIFPQTCAAQLLHSANCQNSMRLMLTTFFSIYITGANKLLS